VTNALRVTGGRPLRGDSALPADLEVTEVALLFAVLATGSSRLQNAPRCQLLDDALAVWTELGAECGRDGDDIVVEGRGLAGLRAPRGSLACGRSPQLLAQVAAVLSAQAFGTRLTVHASVAKRSVEHVVGVLRARGAQIAAQSGQGDRLIAPIAVAPLVPPEHLLGLDATLPRADRDAKAAALISGLFAPAATTVSEPQLSADHVERMAVALRLPLRRIGSVVSFDGAGWAARDIPALGTVSLPGSVALAAHFACTLQLMAAGQLALRGVLMNPSRSGMLDLLRSWSGGAALTIVPTGDAALREPIADLALRPAAVRGGVVGGELLPRAGSALPALAALGLATRRGVRLCDLRWLSDDEAAGLYKLEPMLSAFGAELARGDGELLVTRSARAPSAPRRIDAGDDPELALLACTLALATPGETVVEHAAMALSAMHPGFIETARLFGAVIELA
jgi:3-phosphoshikimate 1-carboxyvinyltransferase